MVVLNVSRGWKNRDKLSDNHYQKPVLLDAKAVIRINGVFQCDCSKNQTLISLWWSFCVSSRGNMQA
jgi:hypothetical protein